MFLLFSLCKPNYSSLCIVPCHHHHHHQSPIICVCLKHVVIEQDLSKLYDALLRYGLLMLNIMLLDNSLFSVLTHR